MATDTYSTESKEYENSLDASYKKGKGIYYTDMELSSRIIKFLEIPCGAYILDPCCGTGNFIVSARNSGHENVYGSDIDANAIALCQRKSGIKNITVLDTLANNGKDILRELHLKSPVDYVIGNPPYVPINKDITIDTPDRLFLKSVKESGSNLFIAAIYRAFELACPDGVISYIIPKNFLHVASYSKLRKLILSEKPYCRLLTSACILKA